MEEVAAWGDLRVRRVAGAPPRALLRRGGFKALLKGGTTDDAADRTTRALDRPELLRRMNAEQLTMLEQQLWRRKLMENHNVPRLSLFYLI